MSGISSQGFEPSLECLARLNLDILIVNIVESTTHDTTKILVSTSFESTFCHDHDPTFVAQRKQLKYQQLVDT